MTLWYFETRTPTGGWMPVTSHDEPVTENRRGMEHLRRPGGGIGLRVRAIVTVPAGQEHLPLNDLKRLYSPESPPLG